MLGVRPGRKDWSLICSASVGSGESRKVELWHRPVFSSLSVNTSEWLTFQKNWMYLESIFSAEDIQQQLKAESK